MPSQSHSLPLTGGTQLGDAGVGYVQSISNRPQQYGGLGFLFSPKINADFGIDGHLEVVNPLRQATGRLLGVQVKTGDSFFDRGLAGGAVVYVEKRTLRYWREYSVPVILVVANEACDRAIWVRVDRGDFPETEGSFKIVVPSEQRFDASAVAALSEIAPPAPRGVLTQRSLSPELIAQNAGIHEALRNASSVEARREAANRAEDFALVLRERGRAQDAISLVQQAVRSLLVGGDREKAIASLCDLAEWVLQDLRDGDSARSAIQYVLTPATPHGSEAQLPDWPHPLRVRLDSLTAQAEAACGWGKSASRVAGQLRELANMPGADARPQLTEEALRLEILAALADENHPAAAEAYQALADVTEGIEAKAKLSLHAMLHRGLAGAPSEFVEAVRSYGVPLGAVLTRFMVLGWLRSEARDFLGARQAFIDAGDWALEKQHDTEAALQAFRNAAAMEYRVEAWSLSLDGPVFRVRDLDLAAKVENVGRATYARLMAEIDGDIERKQWRTATININVAAVRAYQDANPLALQEARAKWAAVCRGAATDTPTPDTIIPAAQATAATVAFLDKEEQRSALEAVGALLGERMVAGFADMSWAALMGGARHPEGVIGAIKIATALGESWKLGVERDAKLAALIRRGLALGSQGIGGTNGVEAACELILALHPPLEASNAAVVCGALSECLVDARWTDLADLLNAIAVTAGDATTPADGGTSIAERLLAVEARATEFDASPQWFGALAMNSRCMAGPPKERVLAALERRARAAPGRGGLEWYAVERAIVAGIDVGPEMGDLYLTRMADLLDTLAAQTRSGGLGGGSRDNMGLTRWASTHSSPEARQRAVEAGIRFLLLEGHLLHEQRSWIPFIAVLARETPSTLPQAIAALLRVAQGELLPSVAGPFSEFTNPFAFMRVSGHTLTALRTVGLSWVGFLLPALDPNAAQGAVEALVSAVGDPEPELRARAAAVARWALDESGIPKATRTRLKTEVIRPASKDHVERVALAALRRPHASDKP